MAERLRQALESVCRHWQIQYDLDPGVCPACGVRKWWAAPCDPCCPWQEAADALEGRDDGR